MKEYTGIRTKLPRLRHNAFIYMHQDKDRALADSKAQLLAAVGHEHAELIQEPWNVEMIAASWGYPDRMMVTW